MSHENTSHHAQPDPARLSPHHPPSPADSQFLQIAYQDGPTLSTLMSLAEATRDLLGRTAELPDTERGLLGVLSEYRCAAYAFATVVERL